MALGFRMWQPLPVDAPAPHSAGTKGTASMDGDRVAARMSERSIPSPRPPLAGDVGPHAGSPVQRSAPGPAAEAAAAAASNEAAVPRWEGHVALVQLLCAHAPPLLLPWLTHLGVKPPTGRPVGGVGGKP